MKKIVQEVKLKKKTGLMERAMHRISLYPGKEMNF